MFEYDFEEIETDDEASSSTEQPEKSFPDIAPYFVAAGQIFKETENCSILVCSGLAVVTQIVNAGRDSTGYLVKYLTDTKRSGQLYFSGMDMGNNGVIHRLQEAGIVIHSPADLKRYLGYSSTLINAQPELMLVNSIGWGPDNGYFYTGNEMLLAPDVEASLLHCERPDFVPLGTSGTLSDWKSQIGVHIEENPLPLAFSCIALASILLPKAGIASGIFNLHGTHGKGKTLCLQLAASLFGNGGDPAARLMVPPPYIGKFNGTEAGLEAILRDHSPLPVILDELGETGISSLDRLCYSMASGQGKSRMRSNLKAANRSEWLLNTLVSSEKSIREIIESRGKTQMGGQADRAADIPLPEKGIFTSTGEFSGFDTLTRHLKAATRKYYGTPFVEFIQYCLDNYTDVEKAIDMLDEMASDLKPTGCESGAFRVVQRLSLAAITGLLAVQAGIFDCDENVVTDSFKYLIKLWWEQRLDCLARVREFIAENGHRAAKGFPRNSATTMVFYYKDLVVIEKRAFDAEFGTKLAEDLEAAGALKREQKNRRVYRFGSGPTTFYGYAIFASHVTAAPENDLTEQEADD